MLSGALQAHSNVSRNPTNEDPGSGLRRSQNGTPLRFPSAPITNGFDADEKLSRLLTLANGGDGSAPSRSVNVPLQRSTSLAAPSAVPISPQSPAAMFLSSFASSASLTVQSPVALSSEDEEGQVIAGYTLGPIIGSGGFSIIRRASSSSAPDDNVAIKIVKRSAFHSSHDRNGSPERAVVRLEREAEIWASLSHEHILPLFSTTRTSYADYFVMLYCPAGTLFDILKRDGNPGLPQDDVGTMFRQVVRGLGYLHTAAGLVHGDMKLENVLVDEMGVCRIADFGMARQVGAPCEEEICYAAEKDKVTGNNNAAVTQLLPQYLEEETQQEQQRARTISGGITARQGLGGGALHLSMLRPHGMRHRPSLPAHAATVGRHSSNKARPGRHFAPGSLPYASPEMLSPTNVCSCTVNPAQDVWATGVMLYTLLAGRLPFWDPYEPRLQFRILNGEYKSLEDIGLGTQSVIQGCLDKDPSTRWTIEMIEEVAHTVGSVLSASATESFTPQPPQPEYDVSQQQRRRISQSPEFRRRNTTEMSPSRSRSRDWSRDGVTGAARSSAMAANRPNRSRSSSRHPLLSPERHSSSDRSSASATRSRSRVGLPSASILEQTVSISSSNGSLTFAELCDRTEDRGRRPTRRHLNASSEMVHQLDDYSPNAGTPLTTPPAELDDDQDRLSRAFSPLSSLVSSPPPLARSSSASSSSSSSTGLSVSTPALPLRHPLLQSHPQQRNPSRDASPSLNRTGGARRGIRGDRDRGEVLDVLDETSRWNAPKPPSSEYDSPTSAIGGGAERGRERNRFGVSKDLGELIQLDQERETVRRGGGGAGMSSWFFIGAGDARPASPSERSVSRGRELA